MPTAPSFISNGGTIATDITGAASTVPAVPAHQIDDIIIIASMNQPGASLAQSISAGWTKLGDSNAPDVAYWWRRATATNDAAPTITAAGTDQFSLSYIIRGCRNTGNPWEDAHINSNTISSPPLNGATTQTTASPSRDFATVSGPNRLVIAIAVCDSNAAFTSGNPPAGFTADNLTSATGTTCSFATVYKVTSTNDTGGAIGTQAASHNWSILTLTLVPVPDPQLPEPPMKRLQPILAQYMPDEKIIDDFARKTSRSWSFSRGLFRPQPRRIIALAA
jgi:hypothetical protein